MPTQPRTLLFDHSPHLRGEWDYERNEGIDPEKITFASHKKVNWKCTLGHSWAALVSGRTRGRNCPICSNRQVLAGYNDIGTTAPSLALELVNYHESTLYTKSSHKKLLWVCDNEHTWEASVYSRTEGNGCPICANKIIRIGFNDVWTTNPQLACQLENPEDGYRHTISANKKVSWVCTEGHKWFATFNNRSNRKQGCPYCYGRVATRGTNDLWTVNPELAKELVEPKDGHKYSAYSDKKVFWNCIAGHVWKATISGRSSGRGCPSCSLNQTSQSESRLRELCKCLGEMLSEDHTYKIELPFRKNKSVSVDICLLTRLHKVVIEYDGAWFHLSEESNKRDIEKTEILLDNQYLVVRIREQGKQHKLPELNISHLNLLQLSVPYSRTDEHLVEAVEQIKEWLDNK